MSIDAISTVTDVYPLSGQMSGVAEDADLSLVDEMPPIDFQAVVQQLNDATVDDVVDVVDVSAVVDVADQVTGDKLPEAYDDICQTISVVYLLDTPVNLQSSDAEPPGTDLPPPVTPDRQQPGRVVAEFSAIDREAVHSADVEQRSAEPVNSGTKSVPEATPVPRVAPRVSVDPAELQAFSTIQSGELSSVAALTALTSRPSVTDVSPGMVLPSASASALPSLLATPSPAALSLRDMMIVGGQHHARAVAYLPNLGTVQVEMTRASACEVAVHLHAPELTVAALDRCSPTLHHLIASTLAPVAATEATVREAAHGVGSESGVKIALSLTSHNQSQADGGEYQQPGGTGAAEPARPGAEQLTLPARVLSTPATALVDLLI